MGTADAVDAEIELVRAAIMCLAADHGRDEDPNADARRQYAYERLAFAARDLARATDNLTLDEQPDGWREQVDVEPSGPIQP